MGRGHGGDTLPILLRKHNGLLTALSTVCLSYAGLASPAYAQFTQSPQSDQDLQLATNSPFRDPDIIYLEADTLTNDEAAQILTAEGSVEGRYQDKTLRADKVVYNLTSGQVIAEGNVVLVQPHAPTGVATSLVSFVTRMTAATTATTTVVINTNVLKTQHNTSTAIDQINP